ncbi:MAG TPA: SAM-dependent methyltransferase, partial [Gemmatimonadaceae bacterium]|nr:SAM-dependent methyltransferase [Gemmatimonadaceae bacterium]
MPAPPISDVSDTAFMIAAQRAIESERPDALFHDPLAGRLAGEHGREIIASLAGTVLASSWSVAIRTCIVDGFIERAVAQGADAILNLGAGLDTRPYRLQLPPALRWIEVDYPKVIGYKESLLSDERPVCRLERVPLDLADRPARESLFAELGARSRHILVLTEGVIPYLTTEDVAALANDLASRPAVRNWVVDYFSPDTYKYRK